MKTIICFPAAGIKKAAKKLLLFFVTYYLIVNINYKGCVHNGGKHLELG